MPDPLPSLPALTRADAAFAAALALLAALLLGFGISGWGLGLNADSIQYADAAVHLARLDGATLSVPEGLARPLLVWPPLYPLALAPVGWGLSAWPQVLHLLLFGGLAAGVFLALRRFDVAAVAALPAALLAAFGGNMAFQFGQLLSEAMFLPLELGLIVLLALALHQPQRRWLVAAGLCAAAATLTRYVGQGMILSGALLLLLGSTGSWRARLARAGLFFGCAQLPVLLWLLRNWLTAGTLADRDPSAEAIAWGWFFDIWRVMTTWFAPETFSRWIRHPLTLATLALGAACLLPLRAAPSPQRALALSCLATAAGYLALMFAAEFGSSRAQDLDQRMLLPVLLPVALLLGLAAGQQPARRLARACNALLAALALLALVKSAFVMLDLRQAGAGYSGQQWQADLSLQTPADVVIASNHPEALAWQLGRPCLKTPSAQAGSNKQQIDPVRLAHFEQLAGGHKCWIVLFESWSWDVDETALARQLGLKLVSRGPGRVIYEMPAKP
ncbi:MAG: hypothetical protein IPP14_07370 [Planctomycetes bacterium]|nr:hypothetical protein [Planctomycetota bacterium]